MTTVKLGPGPIWIALEDGRQVGFPAEKFRRLRDAGDEPLKKVRIEARGRALRWETRISPLRESSPDDGSRDAFVGRRRSRPGSIVKYTQHQLPRRKSFTIRLTFGINRHELDHLIPANPTFCL